MLARTPFFRLVAQLVVFTLFFGLIPAPPARAALPAGERALSLPTLPSLAESVPPSLLAVVVAVVGDEAAPCALVFAVVDPLWPSKYHRARWMDPRTGRFAGMDPFDGLVREPISLHRYLYASADPVDKTDPSGEFSIGAQTQGLSGMQTVAVAQQSQIRVAITIKRILTTIVLATAVGGGIVGPIGVLEDIRRRGVSRELYAFGNTSQPRPPRAQQDFNLADESGDVGPEEPPSPRGASAFGDPMQAPLTGHYHSIPRGILVWPGLGVVADGADVIFGSSRPPTHHTIYPTVKMSFKRFVDLFLSLPWQYAGKK
jgi:RHS repeat-associated protein